MDISLYPSLWWRQGQGDFRWAKCWCLFRALPIAVWIVAHGWDQPFIFERVSVLECYFGEYLECLFSLAKLMRFQGTTKKNGWRYRIRSYHQGPKWLIQDQTADEQFEDVCGVFGIPLDFEVSDVLGKLRAIPGEDFIQRMPELKWHTFRAVTDNEFVHEDLIQKMRDGTFAKNFRERRYRLLIGETENEVRTTAYLLLFTSLTELWQKAIFVFQGQCPSFRRRTATCAGKLLSFKCLPSSDASGKV